MEQIFELEDNLFITKECQKDEIVFKEDETCNFVGFIKSGDFIISSYSFNGNEIVYAKLTKGDLFGNNLIFSSTPKYKGNVICTKKGIIKLISKDDLLKLLTKYPSLLEKYLELSSNDILKINNKVKILSFDNAEERLIYFLKNNQRKYLFNSISSFSKELGLRRETLSRLITYLVNKKVISKQDNLITLLD